MAEPNIADDVLEAAAREVAVPVALVRSKARYPRLVLARLASMWILRAQGWTLNEIARFIFGHADHTSVMHSLAAKKRENDPEFLRLVTRVVIRVQAVQRDRARLERVRRAASVARG